MKPSCRVQPAVEVPLVSFSFRLSRFAVGLNAATGSVLVGLLNVHEAELILSGPMSLPVVPEVA